MLIGVVGKPSAGKSTFFKACTLADVAIANYPFTTIKPNHAVGFVKVDCVDSFFGRQCNPRFGYCQDHKRFVPVDMIDVAGLVPGAHKGEGMGLQFMNDLNQADVLVHVVDISGSIDEKGKTVATLSYDPLKDVDFLERELDYWYLEIIRRGWDSFSRTVQMQKKDPAKEIAKQLSGLGVTENMVKLAFRKLGFEEKPLTELAEEDILGMARELRIMSKPMLIVANKADIGGSEKNVQKLREKYPEYSAVPCSADYEVALKTLAKKEVISYQPGDSGFTIKEESKLNSEQKKALEKISSFLEKFHSTGVQEALNRAVFDLLKYKTVYPGGVGKLEDKEGRVLPDCFLMPEKATALDFAFKLHSDIGKNFIKAINVKTKMAVGKDFVLRDGDVIEIMFRK